MSIHILKIFAKNKFTNIINIRKISLRIRGAEVESYIARTDLAVEAKECINMPEHSINGVRIQENYNEEMDIKTTTVVIESKNAEKKLGKPMGHYITLEAPGLVEPDEDYHREISLEIAKHLLNIIKEPDEEKSILVVGLGNRDVTADSLGPSVVDHLFITRHIIMEYGKAAYEKHKMHMISGIVPGVMAKTGMETAEIVKGVVEKTNPDLLIVVDALAARSTKRLNRTVQITDTGIWPGSGVGNHRNALTEESLGIPVIAIGVPTVVDAATIVNDAVTLTKEGKINGMSELNSMYVTGKDIDSIISRLSYTISEAINIALDMEHEAAQ